MFMRRCKRWGTPLLFVTLIFCLGSDARSQSIGGGEQEGYDPSQIAMSPRALTLGQDPFQDLNFNVCLGRAEAMARANAMTDLTPMMNADPKTVAVTEGFKILGGALGGAVAGTGAGAGALAGLAGMSCSSAALKDPEYHGRCDEFRAGEKFDSTALDLAIAELNQATAQAGCKAARADMAGTVASCFSEGFDRLKDAMQEVKKDFDTNVQAMNQYLQSVKAEVQKEQQKQETLKGKLESLGSVKQRVEEILAKINGAMSGGADKASGNTIAGLRVLVQQQQDFEKKMETAKKRVRANRTGGCLAGGGASTSSIRTCPTAAGELLPPKECILSLYRDQMALKLSGGTSRVSPADRNKAEFAKKLLENRLNQMLADFWGDSPRVGSALAFISKYGSEIKSFGTAGQHLITELKACDKEIMSDMNRELGDPATDLGSQVAANKAIAQEVSSNLGGMINQLDSLIRDAGREVYGQELNELVNGAGCNTATVSDNSGQVSFQPVALKQQLKCAEGLNANVQALLNGTPPPGARVPIQVPLSVPGYNGQTETCKGLRDCMDKAGKLMVASQQRQQTLEGEGTFKDSRCPSGCPGIKKFKADSTSKIQKALQQAADLFARRVASAKAQFSQVKSLLDLVDVTFPERNSADKLSVKASDFCAEQADAKVCEMPADFSDKLSRLAGLPNIEPQDFSRASREAINKKNDFAHKQSRFKKQIVKLNELKTKCKQSDDAKDLVSDLKKRDDKLSRALLACKRGTLDSETKQLVKPSNFDDLVSKLQEDVIKVCENSKDDGGCESLKDKILIAGDDCQVALDDRNIRKMQADQAAETNKELAKLRLEREREKK